MDQEKKTSPRDLSNAKETEINTEQSSGDQSTIESQTDNTSNTNMETHHHPYIHHKKRWKDYLFEFFMLFLAITAGFFVENLREHRVERSREKEYIHSILQDFAIDTTKINENIINNDSLIYKYNLLIDLANKPALSDDDLKKMYSINEEWLSSTNVVVFTERTIAQLKSAGGMRLIQNQKSSDLITQYYEFVSICNEQAYYYKYDQTAIIELSYKLFYKNYYHRFGEGMNKARDLLQKNSVIFNEFINRMIDFTQVVSSYMQILKNIKKFNSHVIPIIKQEYKID
jgi:hypothetical protein